MLIMRNLIKREITLIIMEYKFSDAGEKVYLKACAAGGYKINNEKVYSEWKKAHAEQMINN